MTAAASPTVDGVVIRAVHDSGFTSSLLPNASNVVPGSPPHARADPDPQPSVEEAAASSEEVT